MWRRLCALLLVAISPGLVADDLRFVKHVVNSSTDYSAAALVDVNHNGRLDIVCGGDWYESPGWKKHFVAKIPRIGGRPDGFAHLVFDVNRDGWSDIITVNYRSRSIKWMEHPGASGGPWPLNTVVQPGPMETGRLVDVDGDGQLDVLPNGRNFAAWWEFRWGQATGRSVPAWIRHDLPDVVKGHGAGFGDIDGDGRGDIVGQHGWLQAPADARHGKWTWHPDFRIERGSIPMLIVDPDEDGDNDIVWCSAHGFGVYWLEQQQTENQSRVWVRHAIDTSWSQGHAPLWADLDGDGRSELIAGKRYMSHGGSDPGAYDPLVVYRYQCDPQTKTWNRWVVSSSDGVGMGLDPKVGDIDNDGDPDLLMSGRSGLFWLQNEGAGTTLAGRSSTVDYDGHHELLFLKGPGNVSSPISGPQEWGRRRAHIVAAFERVHGPLCGSQDRVPLRVETQSTEPGLKYETRVIRYSIDGRSRTTARLLIPNDALPGATSGVICLCDPMSGERGNAVAGALASSGYVCLVPELLSNESTVDSAIRFVWQVMRAADVLQATSHVDGERLALVGNAGSGEFSLHAAALDQRLVAVSVDVSQRQTVDHPSGYCDAELIAATAPRSLRLAMPSAPSGWSAEVLSAEKVYALKKAQNKLVSASSRGTDEIVQWLQRQLRPKP